MFVHTEDRPGPGSSGALQTAAGEGALHRPASVDPGLTGKYSLNPNITLDLCRFLGRRARAMTALSPKDADCGDVHCQQQGSVIASFFQLPWVVGQVVPGHF